MKTVLLADYLAEGLDKLGRSGISPDTHFAMTSRSRK